MYPRILSVLLLLPVASQAQAPFVEGVLTYSVSVQPANGQESLGTQAGTYTLTLKGGQVRRDLHMNSGYESTVLYDGRSSTGALLQATPDQKFAVRLTAAEMAARRAPYEKFSFQPNGKSETVAGQACQPGKVTYTNGTTVSLCLGTTPVAPDVWLFSRFPGITAIPVQFDYRNKSGSTVRFRLEQVATTPVEASQFRVPADYKVISAAELHDAGD